MIFYMAQSAWRRAGLPFRGKSMKAIQKKLRCNEKLTAASKKRRWTRVAVLLAVALFMAFSRPASAADALLNAMHRWCRSIGGKVVGISYRRASN